jgi:hypothetical protein
LINGIPLPWGIVVDFATGALWKPNVGEKGVTKVDFKNYNYEVKYAGCSTPQGTKKPLNQSKTQKLKDLKELLDNKTLTQEEFEKEKKKILEAE